MTNLIMPRRSFLTGITSLILSPAIVRADSLMNLRGYNMDPLVLVFWNMDSERPSWKRSVYDIEGYVPGRWQGRYAQWQALHPANKATILNGISAHYREAKRLSELED